MVFKNHLSELLIFGVTAMAFLTQPAQSYVSELGFGLPTVGIVALGGTTTTFGSAGYQKNVEVALPDGATVMVSSVPVVIQNQVCKDMFTVNIPNDKGGYSTIILQKLGNRFIGLPGEFYPEFPKVI